MMATKELAATEHDTDKATISIKDAAERAKITTVQIGRLIKRGTLKIPDYATTWRQKPILLDSFDDWLANRKPAGAPRKKIIKFNGERVMRLDPE